MRLAMASGSNRPASMRIPMAGGRALPGSSMRGRQRALSASCAESSLPPLSASHLETHEFHYTLAPEDQEVDLHLDADILPPPPPRRLRSTEPHRSLIPTPGRSNRSFLDPDLLGLSPHPVTGFGFRLNEPRARNATIYLAAEPDSPLAATMNAPRDEHLEALASLNRAARLGAQSAQLQHSRSIILGPAEEFFDSASAQAGRLYGQAFLNQGEVTYLPSRRLEDWLEGISLSESPFGPQRVALPEVSSSNGGQAGSLATVMEDDEVKMGESTTENRQTGTKRQGADLEAGPSKRVKIAAPFRRALSRVSGGAVTSSSVDDHGSTMARAGTVMSHHVGESGRSTPFSMMSRVFVPAPVITTRNFKICVLGHPGTGKTTRLVMGRYIPGAPSTSTEIRTISTMSTGDATRRTLAQVELWDFPGMIAGRHDTQLRSTFFNAAIICYDLEDYRNLDGLSTVDRRPTFPNLGLRFLVPPEPATDIQGETAAAAINAAGFAECSALTSENCQETWQSIVDYLVDIQEKHEKAIEEARAGKGKEKMLEKAKKVWRGFKKEMDVKLKK
ncbi:uncharacterized protein PODANS_3_5895 [Podospora anserina S mat+]|uniref:Podospora anserina S mat+ genomic DNA chromosome 3, supercontig 2 n=1 Tax=Podospora anserina (strain S / ATCC MYA-4624 / DSM 980 / FGSC 10383) TaxID=515849 RepID=B2B0I4_PODAN|nr:uncharacterized protein PODANS_3_5895 [Podospora anserina S mat+]CAP70522.1 unnamed protein product [Podospora anserina S mat+]